jgi:2,3-dihydro-2,3-dihydroxybenzoate dehydrogenase
MRFDNKIVLVTGAGRGIGAAVSKTLALLGATVALIDSDAISVAHTAATINNLGERALAYVADVSEPLQIQAVLSRIESEMGPVSLLAHVAGVLHVSSMLETTIENWDYLLKVNATGVFNVLKEVAGRMVQRKCGSIVVVTSNAANTPRIGIGAYAASKAAAAMVARCFGLELAGTGIRCNTVSPGSTKTEMLYELVPPNSGLESIIEGDLKKHRLGIPLGRVASAEDVANAVAFLLSDSAQHITLSDLRVDGGATLGS